MQERLMGYLNKVIDAWKALERKQKIQLVSITLAIIAALFITVYLTTRPTMVRLYRENLDVSTLADIDDALTAANIKHTVTKDNVLVDTAELEKAKLELARQDIPKTNSFTYQDALAASSMGTTDTIKRQNFIRNKQYDLEQSLKSMTGINDASVSLEIPEATNLFIKSDKVSKANVLLNITSDFKRSQAETIAKYISSGVEGLTPDQVVIIDQNANPLFVGGDESITDYTKEREYETLVRNRVELSAKSMIWPLYDDVNVVANLAFDWNSGVTSSKTYTSPGDDVNIGVISEEQVSKSNATGTTNAGEPGVAANDQVQTNYELNNGETSTASTNDRKSSYLYNEVVEQVENRGGILNIADSTLGATCFKRKVYEQDKMEQNNLLGGMTWEQFKDANENPKPIEVYDGVVNTLSNATGISPDKITVSSYEISLFIDKEPTPIKLEQIIMYVILALLILLLAYALLKKTKPEEVEEIEPEIKLEDIIVSTQREEQKEEEEERIKELELSKESEIKRQIDKFVSERPEAVAQLLRNWLNQEEWSDY